MPRVIVLLLLLAVGAYLILAFRRLPPEKKNKALKVIIISGLLVLLIVLVLTGRLSWLVAAIGALLPLIPRAVKFVLGMWPAILPFFRRYQQNRQGSMHTQFIRLHIDMLNGGLDGEVLQGKFKGSKLQSLTLVQLNELLEECRASDAESAALLKAYLARTQPGWQGGGGSSEQVSPGDMTEQQARDILGVTESASQKDIINAHKRLMQKLHPDKGGSDYLAQQINRAKDILLKLF